jgi:hypothetical protein
MNEFEPPEDDAAYERDKPEDDLRKRLAEAVAASQVVAARRAQRILERRS